MEIFSTTLSQMAFLFALIVIGYILAKLKLIPENSESVLSKLENYIFIPALVMGTFITNFTVEKLDGAKNVLVGSVIIEIVIIAISSLLVKLCSKDKYIQNIYLYGLCFSNFGFMGNAVVSALFPEIFLEYVIFTLVLWVAIYIWGVPVLLANDPDKKGLKNIIKSFINPMFIGMIIGMIIGFFNVPLPGFVTNLISSLGNCMSPVAMLLTGMTIARTDILTIIKPKSIYAVSFLRLIVYPLIFIGISHFIPMPEVVKTCAICSLAMPLGLNTIVIPNAYGKDTTIASGMALISHILSCITIPIIFLLI